ncbi:electron transport complex protein RnfG [Pseudomonas fluorescens]|uniref:Ion-translocating oxidoreductase complex subunit G n=1 Tax=Pseudomonas fluorescens TaxID=294 RepID=A0A379IIA8_PSEFL|nr:RnfABCDGE type electron transport complex subunit G [Pseudomonas fluorescens]AIG02714.1 electron transporter RnfG [Pseudomonas fluorescens]SUD33118.1 electron transport complex protein RnfG [Pseudomonas fluorescens]
MKHASQAVIVLLIAVGAVGLTVGLQQMTAKPIAAQQREMQSQALLDVLPVGSYDNQPLERPLGITPSVLDNSQLLGGYLASLAGKPNVVVLRSQVNGYGGRIELLIAIDRNAKLLGVKTLAHAETPSLGGHIGEPGNAWLASFKGLSRENPPAWALKKDRGQFDQMAGATITSRAVINALHDALRYFDEHRQTLLETTSHD